MRLNPSMPTEASVTPHVPPSTISRAGISMNEAGETPPMIPLIRMPPAATAIPIAVAAFISLVQSAGLARTSGTGRVIGGRKGEGGDVVTLRAVGEQRDARAHGMAGGAQLPAEGHRAREQPGCRR